MIAKYEEEIERLSKLIDQGIQALIAASRDMAEADHALRKAVAIAWTQAPAGTVPVREAWVESATSEQKLLSDLAEGQRVAALEATRSRRQQLSAVQSLLAAHKAEAEFGRTRPL
jgi:thiamine biosynthesis protein ThiC